MEIIVIVTLNSIISWCTTNNISYNMKKYKTIQFEPNEIVLYNKEDPNDYVQLSIYHNGSIVTSCGSNFCDNTDCLNSVALHNFLENVTITFRY